MTKSHGRDSEREPCRKIVIWWEGEYEGECELEEGHDGPHYDGTSWWDDDGNEVKRGQT